MSENAATSAAPSGPITGANASDRILAGIGDEFDLDASETPDEGAEPTQGKAPKPKPKKPDKPQGTSLDESDFEDAPTEGKNTPRPHDPEPTEPTEPDDTEPEAPSFGPKDRGTKEKPLSFKDLPDDRFIRIKIDGKDETVSLKEAVRGHIRKEAFDRAYSLVQHNADKALALASRTLKEKENIRGELQAFLSNPGKMLGWCMKYAPKVADEFARLYATEYLAKWRDKPELRLQFEHEREMASVREQREAHDKEVRDWERQRAIAENVEAKKKLLGPGFHEGMKLAGFPKLTPEFQDTVRALLAETMKRGPLTPEIVRDAVVRTAKLLQSPNVQDRRPPPVANTPREQPRSAPRTNGNGKDWSQVPYAQRVRDLGFYLSRR